MEWATQVASEHPDLHGAFIDVEGEWLDVLLADGRTVRFRPSQMLDREAPEPARREMLNRLITIGVKLAKHSSTTEGTPGSGVNGDGNGGGDTRSADGPQEAAAAANGSGSDAQNAGIAGMEDGNHAGTSDSSQSPDEALPFDDPSDIEASTSLSDQSFGPQVARGPNGNPFGPAFDALFGATSQDAGQRELTYGEEAAQDFDELDGEESSGLILPIVRAADYFISSHNHAVGDSMVYIPLTDFVGVGLADDKPDTIEPIYYSDLGERGLTSEIGPLFADSVNSLRHLNFQHGRPGLELGVTEIGGAEVFIFTGPANYQSSWFADLDMTQTVSESLAAEYGDRLPLFVPASRTSFFVIMADDPHLADVFASLRNRVGEQDAIYPLPHTVAADGWQEWIPLPDHPAADLLSELRVTHRERIYAAQALAMRQWPGDLGTIKEFETRHVKSGSTVSSARWESTDGHGSIPSTDFISFVRHGSGLPWDEDRGDLVTVRSVVARDVWPEGIAASADVWPPRFDVKGFPTPNQMDALRQASYREI